MVPRAATGVRISMFGIMEDMLRLGYLKEKGRVVGTAANATSAVTLVSAAKVVGRALVFLRVFRRRRVYGYCPFGVNRLFV